MSDEQTVSSPTAVTFMGSDNQAGAHPKVLDAMVSASSGLVSAYGEDRLTEGLTRRFSEIFEIECEVFLVATGTAANSLILSAMCPPWGAVLCHEGAHIINDENTAPEFFTGGARQIGVPGELGKPCHDAIWAQVELAQLHGVHNVKPTAISLTNATEQGTVLKPAEVADYGELAKELNLGLHMDGARFSNAVVGSGASPADLTWRSGVDVLTFGATKNGAIAAEAVVFFNDRFSEDFAYRRKRAGHLWSKHRFLAAQFDAFLADDLWLDNARHANALAARLANGLSQLPGVTLPWPTEANEVFPVLPEAMNQALEAAGFVYYPWPMVPGMKRFVTSFVTDPEDIDRLLAVAKSAV
jgi:threonine aldolase